MSAGTSPGPWRYDYEEGYCGEIIAADGTTIASFVDEPSKVNADLLVSAPCLLAERDRLKAANAELEKALGFLVDVLDDEQNNAPEHRCYIEGAYKMALDEARAALTKHQGATT